MLDYKNYLMRQEQRNGPTIESEKEQLLRLAAREANKRKRKKEKALERQPAHQRKSGLVRQFRKLLSILYGLIQPALKVCRSRSNQ